MLCAQDLDASDVYVWIDVACLPDSVGAMSKAEESSKGQAQGQWVAEAVAQAETSSAQTEAEVRTIFRVFASSVCWMYSHIRQITLYDLSFSVFCTRRIEQLAHRLSKIPWRTRYSVSGRPSRAS